MYIRTYIHIACSAPFSKLPRADSCNHGQLLNCSVIADNLYVCEENSGKGRETLELGWGVRGEELAEDSGMLN